LLHMTIMVTWLGMSIAVARIMCPRVLDA
jgi:hypothetical protein